MARSKTSIQQCNESWEAELDQDGNPTGRVLGRDGSLILSLNPDLSPEASTEILHRILCSSRLVQAFATRDLQAGYVEVQGRYPIRRK